jgi:hypothetical protein
VTDDFTGTSTRPCSGGSRVEQDHRYITDSARYDGVSDRFMVFSEHNQSFPDIGEGPYVVNPFRYSFYTNGELSRDFTYRTDESIANCGSQSASTSTLETKHYADIADLSGRHNLLLTSGGTLYERRETYLTQVYDVFSLPVDMSVDFHVTATPTPSASPSPSPSPIPSPTPTPTTPPSPSPSPTPNCVGTHTLRVVVEGDGTATPGSADYPACQVVTLRATPSAGQLFTGWTIDGAFVGWATPFSLTMDRDHAVRAAFVARPSYPDLVGGTPYAEAIVQLAALGIVHGYQDGRFGPTDHTLRAQMAALICRALGWDGESWNTPFPDRGSVDDTLWRNVGTLAHYGVGRGYADGTYDPTGDVLYAQVISFITRGMVAKGYWQQQPDDPALYPNIPAASGHRQDLATYVHYAGALPGTDSPGEDWTWYAQPSTRSWFAEALWRALDSHFNLDTTP